VLQRLHDHADAPQSGDVFPKDAGCQKVRSVRLAFEHARGAASISDLRLHDLRHTFASMALNEGVSLEVVRKMLGHSSQSMTERYAHLADSSVRDAAARVDGRVDRATGG
jgi:integrase